MNRVNLDPATAAALKTADPGTELVGTDGRSVGVFLPARMAAEVRHFLEGRRRRHEAAFAAKSLDELKAIDAAGGEIPHEEVMKRLGFE